MSKSLMFDLVWAIRVFLNTSPLRMKQKVHRPCAILSGIFVVVLSSTLLMVLDGCAVSEARHKQIFDLSKIPISSMRVSMPRTSEIAPGEKSPLVVAFVQPDGKVLCTQGEGRGPVKWKDLKVEANIVQVNQKGIVSLPRDPRLSDGKIGLVTVTVPSHPDLHAELNIAPRYDRDYEVDFSGRNGMDGMNGTDGIDGTSGSLGSFDPNHPSAGGDGTDGSNGSDGKDGDRGGDALPVQIRVTLRSINPPLLAIGVYANGKEEFFLLDPNGGRLTVTADGGRGGTGGKGGRGGRGGMGGAGLPSGSNGRDGLSGRNGFDGLAGRGGSITVLYEPQAKPFLGAIHLSRQNGPDPIYREQPVGPIW